MMQKVAMWNDAHGCILNSIRARTLTIYKKADTEWWPFGGVDAGAGADALLPGPHRIYDGVNVICK